VNIVDAMNDTALFGPWFRGGSWDGWRAILKAAFALPMTPEEITFFRTVAEREPPKSRVKACWIAAGRRAGKDSVASLIMSHAASLFDQGHRLRPGERALCLALACDRDQAKIVLNYSRSYFEEIDMLRGMVTRSTANGFELDNGVDVAVGTNSFRAVRGRPLLCVVLDEVAFFRDENSASPDEEVYRAILPGMATLPDAIVIAISSPYRRSGLLYRKFKEHFGKDGDELVIRAPSLLLNPLLDPSIVERALADDFEAAQSEWLGLFRSDLSNFVSLELIEDAVDAGVLVRPPRPGIRYVGFADAASGVGKDSYAIGVAHLEGNLTVLDMLHEIRPKFDPQVATAECAALFKSYGIHTVTGDKYAAGFVIEAFKSNGITYRYSEKDRSQLYLEALPLFASGRARLVDNKRLVTQFATLERRTSAGGRDQINHGAGDAHDDACNAAAGALAMTVGQYEPPAPIFGRYGLDGITITPQRFLW
jgi:hypothetical protein